MVNKPARGKGLSKDERELSEDLSSRCRIYFPTRETVLQSKGGIGVRSFISYKCLSICQARLTSHRVEEQYACNLSGLIRINFRDI